MKRAHGKLSPANEALIVAHVAWDPSWLEEKRIRGLSIAAEVLVLFLREEGAAPGVVESGAKLLLRVALRHQSRCWQHSKLGEPGWVHLLRCSRPRRHQLRQAHAVLRLASAADRVLENDLTSIARAALESLLSLARPRSKRSKTDRLLDRMLSPEAPAA